MKSIIFYIAVAALSVTLTESSLAVAEDAIPQVTARETSSVSQAPDLKSVLKAWKQHAKKQVPFRCKQNRYVYDYIFNREKRSSGEYFYQSHSVFRLDVKSVTVLEGAINKNGPRGKPLSVVCDKEETWIINQNQVFAINNQRKEYQKLDFKRTESFSMFFDFRDICFVPDEKFFSENNFEFQKIKYRCSSPNSFHLVVTPKKKKSNWEKREYLLDRDSFQLWAVKIVHPGNNSETVCTFYDYVDSSNPDKFTEIDKQLSEFNELKNYPIVKITKLISTRKDLIDQFSQPRYSPFLFTTLRQTNTSQVT